MFCFWNDNRFEATLWSIFNAVNVSSTLKIALLIPSREMWLFLKSKRSIFSNRAMQWPMQLKLQFVASTSVSPSDMNLHVNVFGNDEFNVVLKSKFDMFNRFETGLPSRRTASIFVMLSSSKGRLVILLFPKSSSSYCTHFPITDGM